MTLAIGSVGVKSCLDKGFLHAVNDGKKLTGFKEELKSDEDKSAVLDLVQEVLTR